MSMRPGLLALLLVAVPVAAWSQSRCEKPVLANTEVEGWRRGDGGGAIVGTARYVVASADAGPNETFTLGIFLSHAASDESHDTGPVAAGDMDERVNASLQFRNELKDRNRLRTWDADQARVELDGKTFPGDFSVSGSEGRDDAITVGWEVWYSDEDLVDALETANEVELTMINSRTRTCSRYRFDASAFRGLRSALLPYWRCSAQPFHLHEH